MRFNQASVLRMAVALLCITAHGLVPPAVFAEVFNGDSGSTAFDDPLNWENDTIPGTAGDEEIRIGQVGTGGDGVAFQNPAVVDLNSGFSVANPTGDMRIGQGDDGDGTLNHSTGNITTASGKWSFLGVDGGPDNPSVGRYNMSGDASFNSDSPLYLGLGGTPHTPTMRNEGYLNITDQATMDIGALNVGGNDNNYGELNQDAGSIAVNDWINIGDDGGSIGIYNMSGGTLGGGELSVGQKNGADGTLNLSGTASVAIRGGTRVGREDGGIGLLAIEGSGVSLTTDLLAVGSNDAALSTAQGIVDFTADAAGVSAIQAAGDVILNDSGTGSAMLQVDMSSAPAGDILLVDVGGALTGTFVGLPQGAAVASSGGRFIDYTYGDGNNIALTEVQVPIPEPATLLLCLVGLGASLSGRRRVSS